MIHHNNNDEDCKKPVQLWLVLVVIFLQLIMCYEGYLIYRVLETNQKGIYSALLHSHESLKVINDNVLSDKKVPADEVKRIPAPNSQEERSAETNRVIGNPD